MEDPTTLAMLLADAAMDAWQGVAGSSDLNDPVGMGADGTPTSRADRILEDAVLEAAGGLGLSVLSEEAGLVDHGSDLIAIVDPLDGSRNAGRGIPFFCTSVAISAPEPGGVEAGVVQNLVTADLYTATRDHGAQWNGHPIQGRAFDPEDVLVAMVGDDADRGGLEAQLARGHRIRDLGAAALEMCLVATGALDAFLVDPPRLRIVDVAAGDLIVREAGGIVVDPATGKQLQAPLDLRSRIGLVAAHGVEAWEAVR